MLPTRLSFSKHPSPWYELVVFHELPKHSLVSFVFMFPHRLILPLREPLWKSTQCCFDESHFISAQGMKCSRTERRIPRIHPGGSFLNSTAPCPTDTNWCEQQKWETLAPFDLYPTRPPLFAHSAVTGYPSFYSHCWCPIQQFSIKYLSARVLKGFVFALSTRVGLRKRLFKYGKWWRSAIYIAKKARYKDKSSSFRYEEINVKAITINYVRALKEKLLVCHR